IVFGGSNSNRTVTITPVANQVGTADISVVVSDGILTNATTFQLSVEGQPLPPSSLHISVTTTGSGSVTPNLTSESLVVGNTYTLTAVPGTNQAFAGWSGSLTSSAP